MESTPRTGRCAMHAMLWRRLDAPGHDACRLTKDADGWRLEGTAVFIEKGRPAQLHYEVTADAAFRSREGNVTGWVGDDPVNISILRRPDGAWTVNGQVAPAAGA